MKHSVPDEEYMDDEYEDDEEYSDEEYQDEDEGQSGRGRLIGVLVGIVSLCLVLWSSGTLPSLWKRMSPTLVN